MQLWDSVSEISGVGEVFVKKLARLEIYSVFDLLYHLPFRYEDRSQITYASQAQVGQTVTLVGTLSPIKNFTTKTGKRMQTATLTDSSGSINIAWFNQVYLTRVFTKPTLVTLYGKLDFFGNKPTLFSPQYELGKVTGIVPIYHETEGLSSKWLRGKISKILPTLPSEIIPQVETVLATPWKQALENIHTPTSNQQIEPAQKRLAFDELFFLCLTSEIHKLTWKSTKLSHALSVDQLQIIKFISNLPFKLTPSQNKALQEILEDLRRTRPMNRMLLGDVGTGKTVVAAVACYVSALNGLPSVIMAPTQILAQQHFQTLQTLLAPFQIEVDLVTGVSKKISPQSLVIVGTQAVLSKTLNLENVGLVVIDEQHRFGVAQRAQATTLGKSPHVLTMTATPIPRTVALIKYGELDQSQLTEGPSGRSPVKTWVIPEAKRVDSYTWIEKQLTQFSAQAFWICPFIEDSESLITIKAAKSEYEKLSKVFPKLKLGLLHGKLKSSQKDQILDQFRKHEFDILVTTPVVEVGVDIPNAIIMVVEASERFGLAQLHQLRGRVGRGILQSYCLLFTSSTSEIPRLKTMEKTSSGTELAEADFKQRGPGQLYGVSQHGRSGFRIASYNDLALLEPAKKLVLSLLPKLDKYPTLRSLVKTGKIELVQPN